MSRNDFRTSKTNRKTDDVFTFFQIFRNFCMIFDDFQALHLERVYLTDACIVQGYVYRAGRRLYESHAR